MTASSQAGFMLLWYLGLQRHILGAPHLAPLRPLFQADAGRLTDLAYVRRLHYAAMCHIAHALDGALSGLMVRAIDEFVRGAMDVPPMAGTEGSEAAKTLSALGHVDLPPIDAGQVADMGAYFADKTAHPGAYGTEGTAEANIAHYPAATVLACPHVAEIASDPLTLAVVERHLGTAPVILGFTAWWSFAGRAAPRDAQLFHLDNADYRFCKLFIQLTDVDMDAGPHAFMERTHDPTHVGALRRDWPGGTKEFDDWYFLRLRKTDAETRHYLGGDPVYIAGPAGARFLVDTRGIHKGLLPRERDRLVCQVVYGVTPFMQGVLLEEGIFPLAVGSPETRHIPRRLATEPPLDYLNRLFLAAA